MHTETVFIILALSLGLGFFTYVFIFVPLRSLFFFGHLHYYKSPNKNDVAFLKENFTYFKQLDHQLQRKFIRRVKIIANGRTFISKLPLDHVDRNQKLLISAAIVQVTFGLRVRSLPDFRSIVIHPKLNRSGDAVKKQRIRVPLDSGSLHLSWNDFIKEQKEPSDGIRISLYESAHALRMGNLIENGAYGFLKFDALTKWRIQAEVEIEALQYGHVSFFCENAATNAEEFFAVAVESFFERPNEFYRERPRLYATMKELFQQDPTVPNWPILAT